MADPRPQNLKYRNKKDPVMDKYRPARKALNANSFVNNPELSEDDRIYLRGIQATYRVERKHFPDYGHRFQIMLIWDYDRIWGSFDFGICKGILMVDPGPKGEPAEFSAPAEYSKKGEDEYVSIYHDFTWRGTCSHSPNVTLNNTYLTKGKIEFGLEEVSGYFEGIPQNEPFSFEGPIIPGPRRISRNLQSFIDEWNSLSVYQQLDSPRPDPCLEASARVGR